MALDVAVAVVVAPHSVCARECGWRTVGGWVDVGWEGRGTLEGDVTVPARPFLTRWSMPLLDRPRYRSCRLDRGCLRQAGSRRPPCRHGPRTTSICGGRSASRLQLLSDPVLPTSETRVHRVSVRFGRRRSVGRCVSPPPEGRRCRRPKNRGGLAVMVTFVSAKFVGALEMPPP